MAHQRPAPPRLGAPREHATRSAPRIPLPAVAREPGVGQWLGAAAAGSAIVLGAIPGSPLVAMLAALAAVAAALVASRLLWNARAQVGVAACVLAPAGVVLASIAALLARLEDAHAWPMLAGAGVAAAAVVGRAWLDARASQPARHAAASLTHPIPTTVRIPVDDAAHPGQVRSEPIEVSRVRTGEEVLALEGEVVAVDGVVRAGEGWALLYPGAQTAVRRVPGDPLLAGARMVDGAVRLLVARVGEDRALVRPARFGDAAGASSAPLVRTAARLVRSSAFLAVAGSLAALVLTDAQGLPAQLSASAAALLAAPLLATRRAASGAMVAGAAAAGARGIVFQDAAALERAGRTTVAALCTHGVITEGSPEVVQIHPLDGGDTDPLLALAAAAETAAEGHPIARAIQRLAETRRIPPESVRRAAFVRGRGITAIGPGGEPLVIGNRQLLLDEGISVAVADTEAVHAEQLGHSVIFMAVSGRVRAVLSLQDAVRPGTRAAVQRIFDLGAEVVLLSGDHRPTVESLARDLDVDHVKAELVPEDQGTEVRRLRETGGPVAVLGRPGHDDAALAAAEVPVVLGAAGGPAGDRGVALASDDVRDAAAALWIARATRAEAMQSLVAALAAGALLLGAAVVGLVAPAVAALFALAVDAFALPTGARVLRRATLRVPVRT